MAKKVAGKSEVQMVPLNTRISPELRRRLLIAKANTGKTIQELLIEFIESGLSRVENDKPTSKR